MTRHRARDMESEKTLKLPDGKTLYYVENKTAQQNDKIIIFIHGLTGFPYEIAPHAMAQQLPKVGYDVVRPYLYHWGENARMLHETTIAINAADIEVLIDELCKTYRQIFVAGHSYGGPCAMLLDQSKLTAVSLWDPSYVPAAIKEKPDRSLKIPQGVLSKGAYWFLTGQAFQDEGAAFNLEKSRALAKAWQKPMQVIHAADGFWITYNNGESFHTYAAGLTERIVIQGTSHTFVEGETTNLLLNAVQAWFNCF